jgi:hypothetical protein
VVDLYPQSRADQLIPIDTDAERLRADFNRIGADLQRVFDREPRYVEASGSKKR